MSDKPEPCLGQIWSYIHEPNSMYNETIQLIAKNTMGFFEYKTLFGKRGRASYYTSADMSEGNWVFDPEAKGRNE